MLRILRELLPPKLRLFLRGASLVRKASACNEIFHCRALAGESDTNISINSDLTVSCNCQDFDGSGHIGNLHDSSLSQIFSGPTARKFRKMLATRKFPTPTCVHCQELEFRPAEEMDQCLSDYRIPYKGIQVENTAHCNLRCHMCNREKLLGLRSGKPSLSLGDVEKIAIVLKEYGIKSLRFYNLGEPFFSAEIRQQIQLIREYNPDIRIITLTNGQLLQGDNKIEAALSMDYIGISLDGITEETVGKYQVGGSFEAGYRNMAKLVAKRDKDGNKTTIVEWIYVLFRWNDHPRQIARAIELAKAANVDVIGFYRGEVRHLDRSRRWYYHPYFKKLGKKSNDCLILNLNNIPQHLLNT